MSPELRTRTQNDIIEMISNLETVDACGTASKVIDHYESYNMHYEGKILEEIKEFIRYARNFLCDRTFEIYLAKK